MGAIDVARTDAVPGCVLVVDDEEALGRALSRRLRQDGHTVLQAQRGAAALAMLHENDVDLVLSDITMPDMDGVELLRRVHERVPAIPVILMTGAPQLESALKAIEYGAFGYLLKPFELSKLSTLVTRALRERRSAQHQALDSDVRSKRSGPRSAGGTPIAEGTVLADRYRIVRLIGAGGMGTVYEAERVDLGIHVAVKVLHAALAGRADASKRFRREAALIATVRHPNIVSVVDCVLEDDGPCFLVMELLTGMTLAQAIAQSRTFSERRCAFVASQMLDALEAAHAANIVHRDLKPENVFLTQMSGIRDLVKLLDFGVAKLVSDDAVNKLTNTGTVLGTPAYMAPEHARGEKFDLTGDLYSVGCVMYEMLAQRPPFVAANYNALLFAIQGKEPDDLRTARPDVTQDMCAVIARAMAKDPSTRFPSARAMREALHPWVADVHPSSLLPKPIESALTVEADVDEGVERER
jgi:CheY-like chemotaxis protein